MWRGKGDNFRSQVRLSRTSTHFATPLTRATTVDSERTPKRRQHAQHQQQQRAISGGIVASAAAATSVGTPRSCTERLHHHARNFSRTSKYATTSTASAHHRCTIATAAICCMFSGSRLFSKGPPSPSQLSALRKHAAVPIACQVARDKTRQDKKRQHATRKRAGQ